MTPFEQKKIEEFRNKFVKESIGGDYVIALQYPQKFESFLLETIRQARIEGAKEERKEQKGRIEQAMVYLFRKLPEWIVKKPRYMSKSKKDSLWSHMCMWINEYIDSLHSDIREKEMV